MIWKVILGLLAVLLAVLYALEVEDDILVVDKSVAISATRAKVFQYISDMTNHKHWFPGVVKFEPVDGLPMDIGKHFLEIDYIPVLGEFFHDNIITGYESPKYIGYVSDTWILPRIEISLERRDSTSYPTTLHWKMYSRRRNYLFKYVVGPLATYYIGHGARQAMFNLKYLFQK